MEFGQFSNLPNCSGSLALKNAKSDSVLIIFLKKEGRVFRWRPLLFWYHMKFWIYYKWIPRFWNQIYRHSMSIELYLFSRRISAEEEKRLQKKSKFVWIWALNGCTTTVITRSEVIKISPARPFSYLNSKFYLPRTFRVSL